MPYSLILVELNKNVEYYLVVAFNDGKAVLFLVGWGIVTY